MACKTRRPRESNGTRRRQTRPAKRFIRKPTIAAGKSKSTAEAGALARFYTRWEKMLKR